MRFEIHNGDFVGTAEWRGPGDVALDMDEEHKAFFERYFHAEHSCIAPAGDHDGMKHQRPVDSEQAFNHAMWELAAYAYQVRQGDGRRNQKGARK